MKQVSIMVPIYNGEKCLHKCVNSMLTQEYMDLNIILVDDGCRDNSGKICDDYAKKDDRVCVIHQKNGGVAAARNAAIDLAEEINPDGYIIGLDHDDWYDSDYIKNLVILMEANQLDCAIGNCKSIAFDGAGNMTREERILFDRDFVTDKEEEIFKIQANSCAARVNDFGSVHIPFNALRSVATVWDKLFKISIIREQRLRFVYGVGSREDIIFSLNYLHFCKKIGYSQTIKGYNYRMIAGSESHRYRETIVSEDDKALGYMNTYMEKISDDRVHAKMIKQGIYLATLRFFVEECNRYFLLSDKDEGEKIRMIMERAKSENIRKAVNGLKDGNLSEQEKDIRNYIIDKKYRDIFDCLCIQ